jgi:hypothetical protein
VVEEHLDIGAGGDPLPLSRWQPGVRRPATRGGALGGEVQPVGGAAVRSLAGVDLDELPPDVGLEAAG